MPKKIPQQVLRDLVKLSEEVVKEGAKQPVRLAETMGKQIGFLPEGWGEGLEMPVSQPGVVQRKKDDEIKKGKELAFWRIRKKELEEKKEAPKISQEEIEEREKQKESAKKAEKKKPLKEPEAKQPRGILAGIQRRQKAFQPETRAGRKISG